MKSTLWRELLSPSKEPVNFDTFPREVGGEDMKSTLWRELLSPLKEPVGDLVDCDVVGLGGGQTKFVRDPLRFAFL
jgi:hypothetical protein